MCPRTDTHLTYMIDIALTQSSQLLREVCDDRVIGWSTAGAVAGVAAVAPSHPMGMLDSARRMVPVPALARWLLGVGIAATLAANIAHGLAGAAVAAWPGRTNGSG